jgi:ABC-2 type transport system ATP-binding protein
MVEVKNLVKSYGNIDAVKNISFTANVGEVLGFLGPNGAGKSTTMNIIAGYLSATSGTVTIDGYDIVDEPKEAKKRIGYLPELPPVGTLHPAGHGSYIVFVGFHLVWSGLSDIQSS